MSVKYTGAISDTDILIHFAKIERLEILELLFEEIVVPYFIYDDELKRKAGIFYSRIKEYIMREDSIFVIKDRKKDSILNKLSRDVIEDKKKIVGPGESECAGYASALGIPIIISDNHTEFKYLDDEFILLNYSNILTLCVYNKYLSWKEAEDAFEKIKSNMDRPTSLTFNDVYNRSLRRFKEKEWDEYLGL